MPWGWQQSIAIADYICDSRTAIQKLAEKGPLGLKIPQLVYSHTTARYQKNYMRLLWYIPNLSKLTCLLNVLPNISEATRNYLNYKTFCGRGGGACPQIP